MFNSLCIVNERQKILPTTNIVYYVLRIDTQVASKSLYFTVSVDERHIQTVSYLHNNIYQVVNERFHSFVWGCV